MHVLIGQRGTSLAAGLSFPPSLACYVPSSHSSACNVGAKRATDGMMQVGEVSGRTFLVTGGNTGIGPATPMRLWRHSAAWAGVG